MTTDPRAALRALAKRAGVGLAYRDYQGKRRAASDEALVAVLRALGEEVERLDDAPKALRAAEARAAGELAPPCAVAWDGTRTLVKLRAAKGAVRAVLTLEDGGGRDCEASAARGVVIPAGVPTGSHRLDIEAGGRTARTWVLSAPKKLPVPTERRLGLFAPVYALRDGCDDGVGDLSSLHRLGRWARGRGVDTLGTLPMLAGYLDEPFDPSPYAPVSRLFFNELFIDPRRTPELGFPGADAVRRSLAWDREGAWLERLRREPLVDYRAAATLKRRTLALLADAAFADPRRRGEIERWLADHPLAARYATFRAVAEARRSGWRAWPERLRSGDVRRGDFDGRVRWYHAWCQRTLAEHLGSLASLAGAGEIAGLYLDLPVGVHADGFDTWRFRNQFVDGISVGAPPDALFSGGQSWGFPPPDPRGVRRDGHRLFALALREHLRVATTLRLDHAAGLRRLYWVPPGLDATRGVYVAQPGDELHAVINIEATRAGAAVIAENLGTVPEAVHKGLARHGVLGMHVAQFALRPDDAAPVDPPAASSMACVNTHDTPTFEAFRSGADVARRIGLGLLTPGDAESERAERARLASALRALARSLGVGDEDHPELVAVLRTLAAGPSPLVLVTLEDLWGETEPQNVPGVAGDRYPSWRKKLAHSLDEIEADEHLGELLTGLASLRRASAAAPGARPAPLAARSVTGPPVRAASRGVQSSPRRPGARRGTPVRGNPVNHVPSSPGVHP